VTRFKLGRAAPLWTPAHMKAASRIGKALDALGPPPAASADFVSAVTDLVGWKWGMFLNDKIGICTGADSAHGLMLRTANTGTWLMPKDADILAIYRQYSGYDPAVPGSDQGADLATVCAFMRATGLLGHKSVGTAPVAAGFIDDAACDRIRWSIQLFGGCRLGVNLPNSAQDQFAAGLPFTIGGDQTIEGGHDIGGVRYDPEFLYGVTWGGQPARADGLQPIAWDWLKKFGEEACGEVFPDFVMSQGLTPDGFDANVLAADLAELAAGA
jgi:hypothetical protein